MKRSICLIAFLPCTLSLLADDARDQFNPVQTALASAEIFPDAYSLGHGNQGVATEADVFSQDWNVAKYPFETSRFSVGHSFTPWLRQVTKGMYALHTAAFTKVGKGTISFSDKYFTLGSVNVGDTEMVVHPNEYFLDLGYSYQITDNFSVGAAARYFHSDLSGHYDDNTTPGDAFAVDLSTYWRKKLTQGHVMRFGAAIKNLGTKINYGSDYSYFIPTALHLGYGMTFELHRFHHLSFNVEANKLLVPSLPLQMEDELNEDYLERLQEEYYDMNPIAGVFKSFADSERGFKGEMEEIQLHANVEYNLFNHCYFSLGWQYESPMQGGRSLATFGTGLKFDWVSANIAYARGFKKSNPLNNTLCIDVAFRLPNR